MATHGDVLVRPSPPARPARRRPSLLTVVAATAAAVVVLLGIGTPLLGIGTFSGADLLRTYEPWRSGVDTGTEPHLPIVSDTVDVVLPGHELFGRQLRDGAVPDWNPLASGGTAFADGTGVGFWSPLSLPYLLLPTWLAPAYVKLLEMLVALAGMVLFLRRLSLDRASAILGGVLFAASGFMVTWSNWPHTQVAALIPLLFWAVERFAQTRTVRSAVPIAAVVAVMLLGGFPAVTGYALYGAAPYLLVRLWGRRLLRGAVVAGGALVLGVGACAVLLLPFLAQLRQLDYLAERGQGPEQHLPPDMLYTAVAWRAFGTETADGVPYWGPINSVEGLSFVGAGALVLVVLALLRSPAGIRWYFAAAAAVSVVLGYVGGPALWLAQQLPVFSDNPVFRIRSVLGFFLAVLAAYGFQALLTGTRRRGEPAVWGLLGIGAYVAAKHLLFLGYQAGQPDFVKRQILLAALPAAVVLAAAFATRMRVVVPVVIAVECLSLLIPFWPRADRADFYPVTGAHRHLAEHLGTDRYGAKGLTLFSGTNVYYGLRSVTGHAFTSREWRDLLLAIDPGAFPTAGFSRFGGTTDGRTLASPLLDVLSVRYFAFGPQDPVLGSRSAAGPAGPAVSLRPGVPVTVPIGSGPLRGVGPEVLKAARPTDPRAALTVEILSGSRVVASNTRRLYDRVGATRLEVPIAGEALTGPLSARLTLRSDGPLAIAAQLKVTRPADDSLRLAYAGDGAVLYERLTSLPRYRFATEAVVVTDPAARVRLLGSATDPDRVVLSDPAPAGPAPGSAARGGPASGGPASGGSVRVLAEDTDGATLSVTAPAAGHLVVADAARYGWRATVDGAAAPLVPADHALAAVRVPAGTHTVTVRYHPPGRPLGAGISVLSVSVLLGAAIGRRRATLFACSNRHPQ
jgi:hypothetical protein